MRQEGRGIGLINKLKAYELQEQGYDTVESQHPSGICTGSQGILGRGSDFIGSGSKITPASY